MLTGVYPHKQGVTGNVADDKEGLSSRIPALDQILHANGYVCRQFGKWRLGDRCRRAAYAAQPEAGCRVGARKGENAAKDGGMPVGRFKRPVFMTPAVRAANAKWEGVGARNTLIGHVELPVDRTEEGQIAASAIGELDTLAEKPFSQ